MNILLVGDDAGTATFITRGLRESGAAEVRDALPALSSFNDPR